MMPIPSFNRQLVRKFRRKVNFGDLARLEPFCRNYGFSRGTAIDRRFIERFIRSNRFYIKGRCLEVMDNHYTMKYGGNTVAHSDVIDVDTTNIQATIYDDLMKLEKIMDETYDCITLTQTMHLLEDDSAALRQLHRVLRPGGTLLLTVPGISKIGRSKGDGIWNRLYTDNGIASLLKKHFQQSVVALESFGNLQLAAAFLYGLAAQEVDQRLFDHYDPEFPIIIGGRVTKDGVGAC